MTDADLAQKQPAPSLAAFAMLEAAGKSVAGAPCAACALPAPPRRLISLDALRGLTVAFMILVNDSGPASWSQLNHADWNGFTATDLVFPTFLFVVGVSIVFSFDRRLAKGDPRGQLARHTAMRAGILILLGIVVQSFPLFHLEHMRFYGVLQRIGLCYLAVGLLYVWNRRVGSKIALLIVLLAGYWILLRWVPVPGAGVPGRDVPFLDRNQNIVAWVDRHLMPGHLYEDIPLHDARDPEGLLSTIPAVGTTLLGLLAGMWLRGRRSIKAQARGLWGGAAACLALGSLWSLWFPLNKKLWTSSYVLVAAGWSLAFFALFFGMMEQKGWGREGRGSAGLTRGLVWPWLIFGRNAIVAFLLSELIPLTLLQIRFRWDGLTMNPMGWAQLCVFSRIPDPGWAAFAFALTAVAICFAPVWWLDRKKIYLKI